MVPQGWVVDCLKMYNISENAITFIMEAVKNWKVEWTAGGKTLTKVKIQRGIFKWDMLSQLLLVIYEALCFDVAQG